MVLISHAWPTLSLKSIPIVEMAQPNQRFTVKSQQLLASLREGADERRVTVSLKSQYFLSSLVELAEPSSAAGVALCFGLYLSINSFNSENLRRTRSCSFWLSC